jgi:hypothetical protein
MWTDKIFQQIGHAFFDILRIVELFLLYIEANLPKLIHRPSNVQNEPIIETIIGLAHKRTEANEHAQQRLHVPINDRIRQVIKILKKLDVQMLIYIRIEFDQLTVGHKAQFLEQNHIVEKQGRIGKLKFRVVNGAHFGYLSDQY